MKYFKVYFYFFFIIVLIRLIFQLNDVFPLQLYLLETFFDIAGLTAVFGLVHYRYFFKSLFWKIFLFPYGAFQFGLSFYINQDNILAFILAMIFFGPSVFLMYYYAFKFNWYPVEKNENDNK